MRAALILCYHHVVAVDPPDPWGVYRFRSQVEIGRFRQQLETLARRYSIVPLHTLVRQLAAGVLRAQSAAITFDDGYADNYESGFPILRRMGVPATIYLATGYIESCKSFWWDRLGWLLSRHAGGLWSAPSELSVDKIDLTSRERVEEVHRRLCERLRALDNTAREHLLRLADHETPPPSVDRPLTWQEASEMQRHGVTFCAHSEWHSSLVALSDPILKHEIEASRDRITARLGTNPVTFAYPYGDVDTRVSRAVEAAGFLDAVTVREGLCSKTSPRLLLPRVQVGNWDSETFSRMLDKLEGKPNRRGSWRTRFFPQPVRAAGRYIRSVVTRHSELRPPDLGVRY
jgi:peptidoglycan/xylan/chitin deacetylase (PgdA/CDA1 family)